MNPQSYADDLQDDQLAKELCDKQMEMEGERLPWESLYRQVEERVDPVAMGGFNPQTSGNQRGAGNLDATAPEGLDRYEAAMGGLLVPRNQRWHGLVTADAELNKLDVVQRWCEHAVDRLFAMRYNPDAGFETQFYEDIRSGGLYGTAPLWVDEIVGKQLFYKALHLSEVWIDEDFRGRVDVTHRKFERTARQCAQQFPNGLSPKMREALDKGKDGTKFMLLSVLRPNLARDPDKWDWRGKRIESVTMALDEKWMMKRSGYHSMPLLVSRASTSPRDKYGRSPAMKVLGSIKGANEMARTILRQAHKLVDPPLLYHDELQLTSIKTKPGGLNPGGVDEFGRQMIQPMQSGGNVQIGMEMLEAERQTIKTAFLDHAFALLFERGDRMTATEVLEIARQQGVLLAPTAGRMETEKLGPLIQRELDIALRAGQIAPPPPEMLEAGASLRVVYENPLSRMARMEEASGFARWVEVLIQLAPFDGGVIDLIDTEAAPRGLAEVLGVRPTWIATADMVKAKRDAREQQQQMAQLAAAAPDAAGAALDLARANQISGQI